MSHRAQQQTKRRSVYVVDAKPRTASKVTFVARHQERAGWRGPKGQGAKRAPSFGAKNSGGVCLFPAQLRKLYSCPDVCCYWPKEVRYCIGHGPGGSGSELLGGQNWTPQLFQFPQHSDGKAVTNRQVMTKPDALHRHLWQESSPRSSQNRPACWKI